MPDEPLLSVRNLSYCYASGSSPQAAAAIQHVTFEVPAGQVCSIVGRSGCGKTTLLKNIAGLMRPTTGTVLLSGQEVRQPSRELAVVFQEYSKSLLPWRNVEANVRLGLLSLDLSRAEETRRVGSYLEAVGLIDCNKKYPWQLSGGMQQRVAIARALARQPRMLLLDEPFGSLDAPTRYDLEDGLLECVRSFGITVLMITHDIDEAVYLSDRVLVMTHGRVLCGEGTGASERDIQIALNRPRDQIETRNDPLFARYRSTIFRELHLGHPKGLARA